MSNIFLNVLKGKVVIVGIGNILRGDDGIGPQLVERLKGKTKAVCFDVGTSPENYIGKIIKENPDTILLIDAIHLDRNPGEYALLSKDDIIQSGLTTHDLSPSMFIEFIEQQSSANIFLLGIQPQNINIGDEITEPVKRTLNDLTEEITQVLK